MKCSYLLVCVLFVLSNLHCVGGSSDAETVENKDPGTGNADISEPANNDVVPVIPKDQIDEVKQDELEETRVPEEVITPDEVTIKPPPKPAKKPTSPNNDSKPRTKDPFNPMDPGKIVNEPDIKPTESDLIRSDPPVESIEETTDPEVPIVEDPGLQDTSATLPLDPGQKTDNFGGLRGAVASYEFEREMKLDSIHRVEFVLSKSNNDSMIVSRASSFEGSENIEHETVAVGDYVTAELIDPSNGVNFTISALSLDRQHILRKDTFSYLWQWDVRPQMSGSLPLRLKVITELEGEKQDIPVFDTKIRVFTPEEDPLPFWIIPTVLAFAVSIGTFLFFYLRRKKLAEAEAEKPLPAELVREVRDLVSDGETLDALELLEQKLEAMHSKRLDEVLLLKANYNKTKKKLSLNQLSQEVASIEFSKVHSGILELLKR